MRKDSNHKLPINGAADDLLVRLGGVAVIAGVVIHFVINFLLKEFPPLSLTEEELKSYFTEQYDTWAIVHGARYLAVVTIALFFAGVYTKVSSGKASSKGWCLVGLIGTTMLATNLMITNGLETLSYLNINLLRENQELFWLLRNMTATLFTGELVSSSLILLGFSAAGWYSRTIPRWIVFLGYLSAASGFITVTFIVNALRGGWAGFFANILSPLTAITWFLSVGVLMLWHGNKQAGTSPSGDAG